MVVTYDVDYHAFYDIYAHFGHFKLTADTENEARAKAIEKAKRGFKDAHPKVTGEPEIKIDLTKWKNQQT